MTSLQQRLVKTGGRLIKHVLVIMATGCQGRGMREFAMSKVTACLAKQELRKAA